MLTVVLTCCLLLCWTAAGFNVDTESFVRHRGAPGSMFGFSVAEHKDNSISWMLVGAPEAQTQQPGVTRGGSVFRCYVDRDDACQEVLFDRTGNNNNSNGQQHDRKSEQWFGATVRSSGQNGMILACAPRYVWFTSRNDLREPVGTCFTAQHDFRNISEYSPCRTRNWGHHRQGSCQAGLGADVSKDGDRLFLGAVGSWYWQGQLIAINKGVRMPFAPQVEDEFGTGQVISQSTSSRQGVLQTREGPTEDDDSYLGYSVVAGDFNGSGKQGVAVGMPRGEMLQGKVVLYTWNLNNIQNISGEQIGAYFGYSLCSSDVDGDGLDDLIIGAPLHTEQSNNEGNYENGRVYVVYQGVENKFWLMHSIDGEKSKARFGLSVAGLGDINRDGYGDFVVGAPYDGLFERGAVYIYHGSKKGAMEKPSQVIYAEDIQADLSTFGFSVAGGLDLDNNEYPDVLVGAYASETAVFLKSRPVIKMSANLLFNAESKLISLKDRNCTTRDGTPVTCIALTACMEYSGVGVDKRIDLEIQYLLDVKKTKDVRMFFMDHEGRSSQNYSIKVDRGRQFCKTELVYIKSSIRDKLTPLEAELRYSLRTASYASSGRRSSRVLTPILDQNKAASEKDSINIEKNCGKDNICIPDLKLITRPSVDRYLLGSGERFEIDVVVENNGEDAFEAMYNLVLPPGMNYIKTERIDDFEHEIPVQCSAPSPATNNTLKCDIGNPLPKRKLVHFKVLLSPFHRAGMKSKYEFQMEVNSTNPENSLSTDDNVHSVTVPIWVQTEHLVSGYSYPAEMAYNMSQFRSQNVTHEADIGPQVVHVYSIKNQGPSDIVEAEAFFVWPSHTKDDEDLLYLLEQPQTNGNVRCERVTDVNAHKIILDSTNKKSFPLELHGILTHESETSSGANTVDSASSSSSSSSSSSTFSSSSSSSSGSLSSGSSSSGGSSTSGGSSSSGGSYRGSSSSSGGSYRGSSASSGGSAYGGGSIGGSTYVQPNRVLQGETRHEVLGPRGGHTMTEEERIVYEQEREESRTEQRRLQESSSSSGSHVHQTHSSSGGSRVQGGGATIALAPGERIYAAGTRTRILESTIPEESGSYQGGRVHSTGGGMSILEEDYRTFGSEGGGRGGARTYEGSSSGTQTYEGSSGGSGAYGGSSSGSRTFEQSSSGSTTYQGSRGGSGTYDAPRGGSRTNEGTSRVSGTYGGSRTYNYSGSSSTDGHRGEPGFGGEPGIRGSSTNDYSVGGSRHYGSSRESSGSRTHEQGSGGGRHRGGGGVERMHHESRNFTATFTENDNAPQTYSNFSYSNTSTRGRNSSGAWETGSTRLGHVGAGHSGSHETRDYGNARETHRQQHLGSSSSSGGGGSRSGYNVGNPSSVERPIGSTRSETFPPNYNEGLAVYNWTSPVNNFGLGGEGRRTGTDERSRHRVAQSGDDFERRPRPNNQEPGFGRITDASSRRTANSQHSSQQLVHEQELHKVAEGVKARNKVYPTERTPPDSAEDVNSRFHLYGRFERSAKEEDDEVFRNQRRSTETEARWGRSEDSIGSNGPSAARQASDYELERTLDCAVTKCTTVKCMVGPLKKDEEAFVGFRYRVWVRTLDQIGWNRAVKLSTLMAARVTDLPHVGEPFELKLKTAEVPIEVFPTDIPVRPDIVPLWVVVLSACAGALILLLLIFLLYKCGFFKRNRPTDSAEKEPLNRNGHYNSGDEAL